MQKKRILFIDDERLLREVIYEILTEVDYEVEVEESGRGGHQDLRRPPGGTRSSFSPTS